MAITNLASVQTNPHQSLAWTRPKNALAYFQPENEILESDKFKVSEDGTYNWFLDNSRYIVNSFYNPPFAPESAAPEMKKSTNEEINENLLFYYGLQSDGLLGYTKTDASVHVPGQHIRTLIGYIEGNAIKMIDPIEDQIVAYGTNKEMIKARQDYFLWLEMMNKMQEQLSMMEQLGVKVDTDGAEDIEETKKRYKHEYERSAEALAKSLYFQNQMQDIFTDAVKHVCYSNSCSIHFTTRKTRDGQVIPVCELIPPKQRILDTRCTDQFMKDQRVGGYIQFKTPAEIFAMFPSLNIDQRNEISNVSRSSYSWCSDFREYFNYPNLQAWTDDGLVAVVRTYFIARRDLRYRLRTNRFGTQFYSKIEDEKEYNPIHLGLEPLVKDGKNVHPKGKDIAGTEWTWDVYYCDVIGNKYTAEVGYADYVVRDQMDKSMPILPIVNLNYDSIDGLGRSLIGRLKYNQMQRDRYKRKLQELTEQDLGKNLFLYLDDEDETELEVLKSLRTKHVKIIKKSSGVIPDQNAYRTMVADAIDLTPQFSQYVELIKFEQAEQEAIINVTPLTLGSQTTVQGKGVQENSVQLASLSQMHLYTSLMSYFNRVINYGTNLWKNCMKDGDVLLPLNKAQTELLKSTRDFRMSDLGIYIYGSDPINESSKNILLQMLQGYAQNIQYLIEVGLEPLDLIKLMQSVQKNSFNQDIYDIEEKIKKNKAKMEAKKIGESQMQAQQQQQMIQEQQGMQYEIMKMKEENANYRAEVSALSKYLDQLIKQMGQNPVEANEQQQQQVPTQVQQQMTGQ